MKTKLLIFSLLIVASAQTSVFAQGRGGGRGGGDGAAAAPPRNPNPPTSPVTGNAANGKALYYNHGCYGCHGRL